jgi:hypothetical protein
MRLFAILVTFCALLLSSAAFAQVSVGIEQARDMAFGVGIDLIDKIELDDGFWKIKGHDKTGHKIKIEIDSVTGAMVKIKRR